MNVGHVSIHAPLALSQELLKLRNSMVERDAFRHISRALEAVASNDAAYTYTIYGFDHSPYITRTLLPRMFDRRPLIHRLWRDDADPHPHNHPWAEAYFTPLCGGYTEERLVDGELVEKHVRVGDVNSLSAGDFHRVLHVEPDTWTLGLVGERVQDWGFLVDGALVPHAEYFARKGHAIAKSEGKS